MLLLEAQELQESTDFAVTTQSWSDQDEWNKWVVWRYSDKIWRFKGCL
jgi:hypothetical protein